MSPRRLPGQLIVAGALLALLTILGTLQYRWLGDVSNAERERMRAALRARALDFSEAFDREITRTYAAFHVDADALTADAARAMADTFSVWQSTSTVAGIVDAVYLVEGGGASLSLKRLDAGRATLEPSAWPPAFEAWRTRMQPLQSLHPDMPIMLSEPIDASIPALVVSIPAVTKTSSGDRVEVIARPEAFTCAILVVLDVDRLRALLIDPLIGKYFGAGAASEYLVSIARRDAPAGIVYTSDPQAAALDERDADVTAELFDLRMDELARLNPPPRAIRRERTTARMAITIVRRGPGGAGRLMVGGPDQGAWQARIRYRRGSLDALVDRSRHRNLAIGLGVLGLLAASFVLIVVSAQRQQRLARQQIEFVAAVSHELRTPLAVIRSAGENLADGVAAGEDQVKRYGALIEREGRRLSDMVERVMEFAGITSRQPARPQAEVDMTRIVAEAVAGLRAEARERGVEVAVRADGSLPPIRGDGEALRSAVQNVVGNAVKYSRRGGVVDVEARILDGGGIRITVVDRGIGIDADELPHIFKPFFRGRRASDAQIRGAGIGLSVVRHVIDAHGGHVRVDSVPGDGTTVTMNLPAVFERLHARGEAAVKSPSV